MTEPKFTPGPWRCYDNGTFWEVDPTSSGFRGGICNIHNAEHIDGISAVEQVANAHLIAAAPELYEALQRLVNVSAEIAPEAQKADVITNARAALAKARGETP